MDLKYIRRKVCRIYTVEIKRHLYLRNMQISDFFIDLNCLPPTFAGFVQLIALGGAYSACLTYAANLICDGSELLLLVPSLSGLIGSVILPILGAVPDACVVLYSGLRSDAQGRIHYCCTT